MVNVTKTNYDTAMLVGARPNFVKVAPLLSKFEENNLNVLFIHTCLLYTSDAADE